MEGFDYARGEELTREGKAGDRWRWYFGEARVEVGKGIESEKGGRI